MIADVVLLDLHRRDAQRSADAVFHRPRAQLIIARSIDVDQELLGVWRARTPRSVANVLSKALSFGIGALYGRFSTAGAAKGERLEIAKD